MIDDEKRENINHTPRYAMGMRLSIDNRKSMISYQGRVQNSRQQNPKSNRVKECEASSSSIAIA